jgi:hypothetical protein
MLIPRFSLRLLLGVTTVCALFFLVVNFAFRGEYWAIAVAVAVAGLVTTMLVHVVVFASAWSLAAGWAILFRRPVAKSPFATSGPPQQIFPPSDPE